MPSHKMNVSGLTNPHHLHLQDCDRQEIEFGGAADLQFVPRRNGMSRNSHKLVNRLAMGAVALVIWLGLVSTAGANLTAPNGNPTAGLRPGLP